MLLEGKHMVVGPTEFDPSHKLQGCPYRRYRNMVLWVYPVFWFSSSFATSACKHAQSLPAHRIAATNARPDGHLANIFRAIDRMTLEHFTIFR
jgi:hypothetical protein